MILSHFALGDVAIGQSTSASDTKTKAPPKRTAQAIADRKVAPEPR